MKERVVQRLCPSVQEGWCGGSHPRNPHHTQLMACDGGAGDRGGGPGGTLPWGVSADHMTAPFTGSSAAAGAGVARGARAASPLLTSASIPQPQPPTFLMGVHPSDMGQGDESSGEGGGRGSVLGAGGLGRGLLTSAVVAGRPDDLSSCSSPHIYASTTADDEEEGEGGEGMEEEGEGAMQGAVGLYSYQGGEVVWAGGGQRRHSRAHGMSCPVTTVAAHPQGELAGPHSHLLPLFTVRRGSSTAAEGEWDLPFPPLGSPLYTYSDGRAHLPASTSCPWGSTGQLVVGGSCGQAHTSHPVNRSTHTPRASQGSRGGASNRAVVLPPRPPSSRHSVNTLSQPLSRSFGHTSPAYTTSSTSRRLMQQGSPTAGDAGSVAAAAAAAVAAVDRPSPLGADCAGGGAAALLAHGYMNGDGVVGECAYVQAEWQGAGGDGEEEEEGCSDSDAGDKSEGSFTAAIFKVVDE